MNTSIQEDREYREYEIKKVNPIPTDPERFGLDLSDGGSLFVKNPDRLPLPSPGQHTKIYGKGFGYPFRGVAVGALVYHYRTEVEFEAERVADAMKRSRECVNAWDVDRESRELRISALPKEFRDRFRGFENYDDSWGPEFGSYELMVCEQAAALSARFHTEELLDSFRALSYDEQVAAFPEIDDGHSGNSWGAVISMARVALLYPDDLPMYHGALCPMVGCKNYGCHSTRN